MKGQRQITLGAASEIRRAFDLSFAHAPSVEQHELEAVLGFRVDREPYALRTHEVAGVFKDWRLTRVPTSTPELLGIAGFHGGVVPVYDLASLLGHRRGERPRWVVLAAGRAPIAFAFDAFDGQFQTPREPTAADRSAISERHARRAVSAGGVVRTLLDVASLVGSVEQRVLPGGPQRSVER